MSIENNFKNKIVRVIRLETLDQLRQLKGIVRMITSATCQLLTKQAVFKPPSKTLIALITQSVPVKGWTAEIDTNYSTSLSARWKIGYSVWFLGESCTFFPTILLYLVNDVAVVQQLKYHNHGFVELSSSLSFTIVFCQS